MLSYQNNPDVELTFGDDLVVAPLAFDRRVSQFDLFLNVIPRANEEDLFCELEYSTALWTDATAQRMLDRFVLVVEQLAAAAESVKVAAVLHRPLHQLSVVDPEERQIVERCSRDNDYFYPLPPRLKESFGGVSREGYGHVNVHETLEKAVRGQGKAGLDKVAVAMAEQTVTYGQLLQYSNAIALLMLKCSRQLHLAGAFIGLYMERTPDLIIGMLAILRVGAVYVPLDPAYPHHRLQFIMSDTAMSLVVTQPSLERGELLERFPKESVILVSPDTYVRSASCVEAASGVGITTSVLTPVGPDAGCYVIYTSGSTGKPKGIVLRHGNILSLMDGCDARYNFTDTDVWSFFHSFCFGMLCVDIVQQQP
jgi:non-ribosomal peptide synthetase component F